jgi:hypothetical protein
MAYYDDDNELETYLKLPDKFALIGCIIYAAILLYFIIIYGHIFSLDFLLILGLMEASLMGSIIYLSYKICKEDLEEDYEDERTEYFLELDQALKRRNR